MSKNNTITHRHHYVPKGYIKGFAKYEEFADDRIKIHAKPLNTADKEFTASVADVALKYDYNTLKSPVLFKRVDEAEYQLQAVENTAIPIIRRIENGDANLDHDQREALSWYLALQVTRVPRVRAAHEEFLDMLENLRGKIKRPQDIQKVMDSYSSLNYPDFNAYEVWQNLNKPQVSLRDNLRLQHLENTFLSAQREFPFIQIRQWKFVYFDNATLITSDAPISTYPPKGAVTKETSTIGGVSGLLFPVARTVALSIGDYPRVNLLMSQHDVEKKLRVVKENMDGKRDRVVKGSAAIARHYNAMTAHFAHKYLYCHPDDANFDAAELKNSFTL